MPDRRVLLACLLVVVTVAPAVVGHADGERTADADPVTPETDHTAVVPTDADGRDRPPPTPPTGRGSACSDRDGSPSDAAIAAVYPNPAADRDRGEFVTLRFPTPTDLRDWTLADEDGAVALPNRTVSGPVVVSADPGHAANLTDRPVVEIDGGLALSNAGETVTLARCDVPVDSVSYADAPEAERWVGGTWRPLGATDLRPVTVTNASVRTFALPDAPSVPIRTLRSADERLLLAGYTFRSERATRALADAEARGVETRVLLDGSPVGGLSRREARLLDRLVDAGVEVRVLDGPLTRYAFHHPKYAVADDRALVTSENWKPSGTGGHANRGWGVLVRDGDLADGLARVFRADAGWRAAVPWQSYRRGRSVESGPAANGSYPTRFRPGSFRVERARLLVAPETAEDGVVALLRSADRSIAVEQVSVEPGSPFLRATVAAARRGVRVRVLLSAAWYVREDNRRLVDRLNRLAAREGLPLSARLVEPRSRFEKVHVKGLVVDERRVVVGSLNWNTHSARENREVVVVLEDEEVGEYYADVFAADWRGGAWRVTIGTGVALAVSALLALAVASRTIRFDGRTGDSGRRSSAVVDGGGGR